MPQNKWDALAAEVEARHAKAAQERAATPAEPAPADDPTEMARSARSRSGPIGEFASSAWDQVNPWNIVKGLKKAGGDAINAGGKLLQGDVAGAMGSIPLVSDEARRIKGVWTRPDSGGVNDRPLNRAVESIPLVGGILRQASDQSLEGNWGGAAGTLAGAGAATVLGPKAVTAAGTAMRTPLRAATRTILNPSISDAARRMTGLTGRAADNALAETAMDAKALPRFFDPRVNPAEKVLTKAEGALQSSLDDAGSYASIARPQQGVAWDRAFKRTGDTAAADAAAAKVPTTVGDSIRITQQEVNATPHVRSVLDDTGNLNINTKLQARRDMQADLRSVDGRNQTGSSIAREVAAERPLRRGETSAQAPWKGNMGRAQLQGRRQVLADKLDAVGRHDLAQQARQVQSLAALDELYAHYQPLLSAEGVPLMKARQAMGVINRAAAQPVRAGVRISDAMQRTGKWADESMYRKAMLAALAQSGRNQEER